MAQQANAKTRRDRPKNFTTCRRMEQQLYHNAQNLLIDACILFQHRSYPTSFALAVLAYEELGKLHLLSHVNGETSGSPAAEREASLDRFFSRKAGFNHVIKQRWALAWTKQQLFSAMYHDGHLDRLKQACFYVGFRNGRIVTPDRVKARTAYDQIKRVLNLARNTQNMAFLYVGDDGKWDCAPADQSLVDAYMASAEEAVRRLRAPTSRKRARHPRQRRGRV